MKAYQGKSVTYNTAHVFTKTTAISTTEEFNATVGPVYTVPTGRTAKVQYLSYTGTTYLVQSGGGTANGSLTPYVKINSSDTTNSGLFLTSINAIDTTSPKNIYLSAGDDLYLKYNYTFPSASACGPGSTLSIYPSFFISIIEEYEV